MEYGQDWGRDPVLLVASQRVLRSSRCPRGRDAGRWRRRRGRTGAGTGTERRIGTNKGTGTGTGTGQRVPSVSVNVFEIFFVGRVSSIQVGDRAGLVP